jgi:predicted lipoprotein
MIGKIMASRQPAEYHVILILTDGEIHDMDQTKRQVVIGSKLPISIIIVGVGDENFTKMVELDGDDKILRDQTGTAASRDIVQFVKFNEFNNRTVDALAEEVLAEVPDQLVNYAEL